MYNFGRPAPLKAWVDNLVRVGLTFDFDPSREDPSIALLADRPRRAVVLTSRGSHGFDAGGALAAMNHADTALRDVLAFVGITDVHTIAVEHEEAGGDALAVSVAGALQAVDALADAWQATLPREMPLAA
jgi:FMN-dependent NADH-azoreductase